MKEYTTKDLAKIRYDFDINTDPGDETARIISEMGGSNYGDITPASDMVEQNPLSLPAAATDLEFVRTSGFRGIMQVLSDRIEFFDAKSKNLKLSRDERDPYRERFLGGEDIKLAIAEFVNERRLRLQNASVEERKALGANAKAKIAQLTAGAQVPDELSEAPSGWTDEAEAPQPAPFDNRDDVINPEADLIVLDGIKFITKREDN